MILVTDENRDNTEPLTLNQTLDILLDGDWSLHAILSQNLIPSDGIGTIPEEQTANYTVFIPEEDLSTDTNYTEISVDVYPIGSGCCASDYVPLAFETGGAVWNLNKLREGGFIAAAFTEAFVEISQVAFAPPDPTPTQGGGCPYSGILILLCPFWWLWNFIASLFGF